MDLGGGSHYRACWNVAFSSLDNVIAPLVGMDLQAHLAVLDGSSQIFSTISDGVRSLSDNLYRTMRQWSMNLLVQVLFSGMVMLNPRLTKAQQLQLLSVITRALEQLFLQHSLDERLTKGLIALACPDRGSRILVTYLVEVLRGLASSNRGGGVATAAPGDHGRDLESEQQEDVRAARALRSEFGIDRMYIAAMPASVRKAVLVALTRDHPGYHHQDHSHQDHQQAMVVQEPWRQKVAARSSPICSITLEPLLLQPTGKIGFDVVAVIQGRAGDDHAFLYRGTALYKWLAKPQLPICPETRSVITPMDVYRLS